MSHHDLNEGCLSLVDERISREIVYNLLKVTEVYVIVVIIGIDYIKSCDYKLILFFSLLM